MRRVPSLSLLFAVLLSPFVVGQQQARENPARWVFTYAKTATELVPIADITDDEQARQLSWAICSDVSTKVALLVGPVDSAGHPSYRYQAEQETPPGSHCLLVDSKSGGAMFVWGESQGPPPKDICIQGFSEMAEKMAGRPVASCYFLGGHGIGFVEVIQYKSPSAGGPMVALLADEERQPDDHRYWIARFPADNKNWQSKDGGNFHPEQFRNLFTIVRAPTSEVRAPTSDLRFMAIEHDGPDGIDLTLYQPVGSELKPVISNHKALSPKVAEDSISEK